MTREEAADLLDNLIGMVEDNQENDYDEALKMAIEALNVTDTNVGDTISRQAAIRWVKTECNPYGKPTLDFESGKKVIKHLEQMPSAQPEQRWIPVKTRPMTEEERQYWEEHTGVEFEDEDAVCFDCQMPDDGQEIWVCSKCGNVWQDTCVVDEGIGLEENGDWLDIVAWMPFVRPEPWKGEDDANNNQI